MHSSNHLRRNVGIAWLAWQEMSNDVLVWFAKAFLTKRDHTLSILLNSELDWSQSHCCTELFQFQSQTTSVSVWATNPVRNGKQMHHNSILQLGFSLLTLWCPVVLPARLAGIFWDANEAIPTFLLKQILLKRSPTLRLVIWHDVLSEATDLLVQFQIRIKMQSDSFA